jgi:hypothetical protein
MPPVLSCHDLSVSTPHLPSYQDPQSPYSTALDAIQSTRLVRQGFKCASNHLNRPSKAYERVERRVRFEVPRSTSLYTDGVLEKDRTRHRTNSIPSPRSILRPTLQQPTIYIVTFSTDIIPNHTRNVLQLLDAQLPHRKSNPSIHFVTKAYTNKTKLQATHPYLTSTRSTPALFLRPRPPCALCTPAYLR